MIELYLLEHLQAFSKYGTLSAAAEHLHIAQPSLSRSMQKLEGILNVTLFERQKNRITLNETGKLAAEYAKRILDQEAEMERHILTFDRSRHTLTIGSCAPGPLMELLPKTTGLFPNMTVSSAINTEDNLMSGLKSCDYSLIILPKAPDDKDLYCIKHCTEHLYLSITPFHPAASYQEVTFADMDGQNFIMYAHVGFWESIVHEKMPHSKFFKQDNLDAVGELTHFSDLPSFSSSITLKTMASRHDNRIHIPFSDAESCATYYLICKKQDQTKWNPLFKLL
ncbi:MAG: LysR family transcriptional regulator [Eubacteriales bacterium]|nr:LysR family transcriptional regulator [Eubacteriales bacterium]